MKGDSAGRDDGKTFTFNRGASQSGRRLLGD
jgi:hypothetical protein